MLERIRAWSMGSGNVTPGQRGARIVVILVADVERELPNIVPRTAASLYYGSSRGGLAASLDE